MHPALQALVFFLLCCGSVAFLIVVHEHGHYLGGMLIGIPRAQMKIRLLCFPQHVALRDGEDWISPLAHERYVALFQRLAPSTLKAIVFITSGPLVETFFLIGMVYLLQDTSPYPLILSLMAFAMHVFYLVSELLFALTKRVATGDMSSMWLLSKTWTILFTVWMFGMQGWMIHLSSAD